MDIRHTFDAIQRIEDSDGYKHSLPDAMKRKSELDEKISKFVWE